MAVLQGKRGLLVAFLALQGRPCSRSQAAGVLFSDYAEEKARRMLTHTLYRLKQEVGGQLIEAGKDRLQLSAEFVDIHQFQRLANADTVKEQLEAVRLYRGDLVPTGDADWLMGMRALLREKCLELLASLTEHYLANDAARAAVPIVNQWLSIEPLDEAANEVAIRLYAQLGRPAAAIQQYERLKLLLADELALEPNPALQAFVNTLRPKQASAVAQSHPTKLFIGRKTHLQTLLTRLSAESGSAFIEGGAGLGKTSLLNEVVRAARWRDRLVGVAKADETTNQANPLVIAAINQALTPHVKQQCQLQLSPLVQTIVRRLGVRLFDGRSQIGVDGPMQASVPHGLALAQLIAVMTQTAPLVLIFEDVHWASREDVSLFEQLLPETGQQPLTLLFSYRRLEGQSNQALWDFLMRADQEFRPDRVRLAPFTAQESAEFISHYQTTAIGSDSATLHQLSGGNPLVLQTLLQTDNPVEQTYGQLFAQQFAQLSADAQMGLSAAAVLNRPIAFDHLQQMVDFPLPVAELVERFLYIDADGGFAFQHDLMRTHTYQRLAADQRRALHQRALDVLTLSRKRLNHARPISPQLLAQHAAAAGLPQRATDYYCDAAEWHLFTGRVLTAQQLMGQANAILTTYGVDGAAPGHLRVQLLQSRCDLILAPRQFDEGAVEALIAQAVAAGVTELVADGLSTQFAFLSGTTQFDQLQAVGQRLIDTVMDVDDRPKQILAHLNVANALTVRLRKTDEARQLVHDAREICQYLSDNLEYLATAILLEAYIAFAEDNNELTKQLLDQAEQMLMLTPMPLLNPQLRSLQSYVAIQTLDFETAREQRHWLVRHHRQHGKGEKFYESLWMGAHIAKQLAQHDEAVLLAEELLREIETTSVDMTDNQIRARAMLGECLLMARRVDQAAEILGVMDGWLESAEISRASNYALSIVALLHFYQENWVQSVSFYGRLIERERQQGSVSPISLACYAEAAYYAGEFKRGLTSLAEAESSINDSRPFDSGVPYFFYVRSLLTQNPIDLASAYALTVKRGSLIRDRQISADWYNTMPVNSDLIPAFQRLDQPERQAVTLGHGQTIWVTINDNLYDKTIKKKADLRRHRILRLEAEAIMQGAALTQRQLADLLGVNVRTIERDKAYLVAANSSNFQEVS